MKIFLSIIAWFGTLIVLVVTAWASWGLWEVAHPEPGFRGGVDLFPYVLGMSVVGLPFMLIGGLIAKPRFFWFGSIVISLIYLIPVFTYTILMPFSSGYIRRGFIVLGILMVPALIGIVEGIFIRRIETRNKVEQVKNLVKD